MLAVHAIANLLHMLAAIVWVGGMFFAYVVLRPAVGALEPGVRLELWSRTLANFFRWVWVAIVVLVASGLWMVVIAGGFAVVGVHVHIMLVLGLVMMALFLHLYFAPYRRLRAAVDTADNTSAAAQLGQVRRIVALNLALGLITSIVGSSGSVWG